MGNGALWMMGHARSFDAKLAAQQFIIVLKSRLDVLRQCLAPSARASKLALAIPSRLTLPPYFHADNMSFTVHTALPKAVSSHHKHVKEVLLYCCFSLRNFDYRHI